MQRDDQLAQRLAAGRPGRPDDALSMLLAASRDDIRAGDRPPMPLLDHATHQPVRRLRQRIALAAAAMLITGSVTMVALANKAQPHSPLWPITELVYTELADLALTRQAIGNARTAITQGRYADATANLEQAASLLTRIPPGAQARELSAEIDTLRRELAARLGAAGQPVNPAAPPGASPTLPGQTGHTPGAPNDPGNAGQRPVTPTPAGQPTAPPGHHRPPPGGQEDTSTRSPRRPPH